MVHETYDTANQHSAVARFRGLGDLFAFPGAHAPGFMLAPAPQAGLVYVTGAVRLP